MMHHQHLNSVFTSDLIDDSVISFYQFANLPLFFSGTILPTLGIDFKILLY